VTTESDLIGPTATNRPATLAVDVGGTKLAVGLVNGQGEVLVERRRPTASGDSEDIFARLADLVQAVLKESKDLVADAVGIGVGCGGPMTGSPEDRLVSPLNIDQWRDFPLARRLSELFDLPAVVDNDAKALALAEGWCGAAEGCQDYLAMVVSTGVGGGLVVDGRLVDGASGNAGHIGHIEVVPDGPLCHCGARGCLEAVASGPAIARMTGRPAAKASVEVRRKVGDQVGRAAGAVVNLLDLGLVVVAGSVALGYGQDFFDAAQSALDRACGLSFTHGAQIIPAGLGADGPLVGAAAVWHHLGDGTGASTRSWTATDEDCA